MTTAHMQKKVTIEQYERLYFLLLLKETSPSDYRISYKLRRSISYKGDIPRK